MRTRVMEDPRSSKLVEPFNRNAVDRLPLRQRNQGDFPHQPFDDDQWSYRILRCDHPSEIEFSSKEFCALIAISDGDIRIRKDFSTVYDGHIPVGALCFMAGAKCVGFEPRNPVSMIVLRANQTQVDAFFNGHSLMDLKSVRGLGDFNFRSTDLWELSSSLLHVTPDSAKSLAAHLVKKVLKIGADASRPQKLPWWRLRKVKEYVRENISGRNCLPELAEVAGLSRMHFAAQFKAATCLSPHEFVLRERSKAAAAMLSESAMPIIEIALSVGFQNQAHFSTVFKAIMGVTPATFRRSAAHQVARAQSQSMGFAKAIGTSAVANSAPDANFAL